MSIAGLSSFKNTYSSSSSKSNQTTGAAGSTGFNFGGFKGFGGSGGGGFGQKQESKIKETDTLENVAKLQNESIPKKDEKKDATSLSNEKKDATSTKGNEVKSTTTLSLSFNKPEPKDDYIYAASVLDGLIKIVDSFQKTNLPIEGTDAFEKRLSNIIESATRSITHTLITLTNELDHGNSSISEYRSLLETSKRDLTIAMRPNRSGTSPFLIRYVDSIQKRGKILEEELDSFSKALESDDTISSSQSLKNVLMQQQEAIIRCGSKVSQIKDKANDIQKEIISKFKIRGIDTSKLDALDEDEAEISRTKTIKEEYEQFLQTRKHDLEKHETNEEKFKKPEKKAGNSYSFGNFNFGNSTYGKTGTNTSTTTGSNAGSGGINMNTSLSFNTKK
ncbi:hypothetical protein GPJ56_005203 [Histomonas meleagridis]|uniref:uncharacterized protein n=1 Tax=Histomonas meleagridis TaxID=135588 RepID=UPI00355A9F7C|nr:hypothetical protein GPJ56_005203 [Histomonas meleagridis]KAH0802719.1 hypothetical protein GO595_004768 [Histomonas meleagridis]